MYEYILKWGLNVLTKAGLKSGEHEKAVILEAIKTKNALVLERFKVAESACRDVIDLTMRVEEDLKGFQAHYSDGGDKPREHYLRDLELLFHPTYFRQYRKIRTRLDITNDLLSGYALGLVRWLRFSNMKEVCEANRHTSPSSISRAYRMTWTFAASTLTRLVRLTSNDPRFWLTDKPYTQVALRWAYDKEIPQMLAFFKEDADGRTSHFSDLESEAGLKAFWTEVENAQ